jgi:hypothetical protein
MAIYLPTSADLKAFRVQVRVINASAGPVALGVKVPDGVPVIFQAPDAIGLVSGKASIMSQVQVVMGCGLAPTAVMTARLAP